VSIEGLNDLFPALEREGTLVDRVTRQMESLIVSGKLRPGEPMPPEARLAQLLGVSRTVVREAVSRLEARHLLRSTADGMVVSAPTAETVGRSMSLMLRMRGERPDHARVLEVRRMLEGEIAEKAAARRTEEDLILLAGILDEAEASTADPTRFATLDMEFHRALALATQNELYVVLLEALTETLMMFRRIALQNPATPARALRFHRAIYDQVVAGAPAAARAAMLNHMLEAETTIHAALDGEARTNDLSTELPGSVSSR
jgi:DNA-binding FadR family transcriptional regulator